MTDAPKPLMVRLHKTGIVAGFTTTHPTHPFAGTVRPATVAELREQAEKESACRTAADRTKCEAEFYAARIASWSLVDETGAAVPHTADLIAALPPEVFHQLYAVVSGACGDALAGK